jgi:hypothetical protein
MATCRYTFWVDTFCQNAALPHNLNRMGLLLCGPTGLVGAPSSNRASVDFFLLKFKSGRCFYSAGTGKTVYINNHLLSGLDKEKFAIITLGFSAQTTANQTQDIIEAKLGIVIES